MTEPENAPDATYTYIRRGRRIRGVLTNIEAGTDPLRLSYDHRPAPDRSTMPDNPPTKATIIAATILCVGFALMLILIGIAAIIWAL